MRNSIINNIKNIRELKNYTQEYMACQLGLTQSGYNKIEKGKTILGYNRLIKIAGVLEVSVDDIISFQSPVSVKTTIDKNSEIDEAVRLNKVYMKKIKSLEKALKSKTLEFDSIKKTK
ncbi:helix-turn-helix domain-containing protein [Flavobacterium ajazii]|uniref:helix-turn-helix domain-containing protein n=1 Tax=Flavobacterium ajazii TaxID=2692318 RepID=UPI0013D39532|nr:helix-turn-helix transcriptional regulator [Flavobacterium ajazii]